MAGTYRSNFVVRIDFFAYHEVKGHYPFLREQSTLTPAVDANGKSDNRSVPWLGGVDNQRHLYLAAHNSPAGMAHNAFCIQFLLFSLVSSVVVVKPFNVLEKFKEACKKILGLCLRITGEEVVNWHIELTEQEDDQADENEDNAAENDDYYKYELKLSAQQNFTVTLIPGEHELDRICVARGRFRRWHLNCHCSSHSGDRFDE